MKNNILLFLFLIPAFLFAQYPTQGNKSRLGYQTTGDGLIWRGVAADTSYKPIGLNYPYFQLDTVNGILRRYIKTRARWQSVGAIDSLVYATRYWVNSNFFPLEGGTLTGTGGAGFVGFPSQVSAPGTPASGLNVYAQGSTFNWKGTDGYERQFASTLTGGRTYTLPNVSGTFALGTGTANRIPIWTSTNALGDSPILYNSSTKRTTWDSPGVIELPMGTDAQRPSPATTSDFWYNTTGNGIEWYNGTRWAKAPEFLSNRGTQYRIPYPNANGQYTESANLTYTGTRFQTGGSIRIGYQNVANDTASIEKVIDGNSKIIRFNAPGGPGNFGGGFVFRGGQNGTINNANTFRIHAPTTNASGSVYVGAVTDASAGTANATTLFGLLNKITSTTSYDNAINIHPNETSAGANYSLALGKQFGIFIGNRYNDALFTNISDGGAFGVYIGYQRQPLAGGYGSSMVFSAKSDNASIVTEVMRLQGKDGNICLGCTNAQYQLYTSNTGAYGIPRGTVAQRPTIIPSTTPVRYNTDSTALEYGESVGVWRQLATRAYARSLVSGLPTTNIYTANGSLTADRTLHGAGYTLRINANTIFRDSLKIGNLVEPSDADSIVITKAGWIGKQKFLVKNYRDSIRTYGPNGFFSDKFASGFMSSRNRNTNLFYADTTGFIEISNRSRITNLTSALYLGVDNGGRYITLRSQNTGSINDFTVSQNGLDYSSLLYSKIFAVDSAGTLTAAGYGAGSAKTLGALSKTFRSLLGVATDGTIVNIPDNTERYNTITSTSSPQTLSSTIADNLINQGGTQATFTFQLPASPVDGQISKATFANAVTVLTIDGNGTTVTGTLPTTANVGQQIVFKNYTGLGWVRQL